MHAGLLKVHMILCFLHEKSRRPLGLVKILAVSLTPLLLKSAKAIDIKLGQLIDEDSILKMCPLFFPGLTYAPLNIGNSNFMLRY